MESLFKAGVFQLSLWPEFLILCSSTKDKRCYILTSDISCGGLGEGEVTDISFKKMWIEIRSNGNVLCISRAVCVADIGTVLYSRSRG